MAEQILFGIVEEVLKKLGSNAIDEIALTWKFKDRLEQLKKTMDTIKNVLLDAEERQADSPVIRHWLERLAGAVYQADDLFDEVATIASRKHFSHGNKFSKEVCTFFSRSNQIACAIDISKKIKAIRKNLDDIVKDSTEFGFVIRPREEVKARKGRDQTHSYVDADEIIGRDPDKKYLIDVLLSSNSAIDDDVIVPENEVLPVIPIVGIGGMGKTTLAQLVYNDPQVGEHFEMRLWVCVSDVFDVKGIAEKIIMSATNTGIQKLEMEQVQGRLRMEIGDKLYLLVLDDVWNEEREEWLKLRSLLKIGRKGSKILVTTRSRGVAKIMSCLPPYDLQGLSEEKSWELFEKMAFEPGQSEGKPQLVEMGKEIVRKCANVPLAIRTLGSLLYGRDEGMWKSLKDTSLLNMQQIRTSILGILKLSYQQLWSPLKSCFAYCALFPKDYKFRKEELIDLWMAQGFLIPTACESQSLDEVGEEYFMVLLQRCFFQDVERNAYGAIKYCKMHDLMHDLALEVAGENCKLAGTAERNFNGDKLYHVSFDYTFKSSWKIPRDMLNLQLLRTFLLPMQLKDGSPFSKYSCQQLISNYRCLRVLDLSKLGIRCLPSSIGTLIHLRYLNLSITFVKELPSSITGLHNLQTLNLCGCERLTILPVSMRKLVNLRSLDIGGCDKLKYIPSGLGELTSLRKLTNFVVNSLDSPKSSYNPAKLSDMKNLNNLRGVLCIAFLGSVKDAVEEDAGANLSCKQLLTNLQIVFDSSYYNASGDYKHDEEVLEGLKPNPNIRRLLISCYRGQKLPSWAMMGNLCINLSNLVDITLRHCKRCLQVPSFSKLFFLKRLYLKDLRSVEYMESDLYNSSSSSTSSIIDTHFFPSLEELYLVDMMSLKGRWTVRETDSSMSFSRLSRLFIYKCPNLEYVPPCPNVRDLTLIKSNRALSVLEIATSSSSSTSSSSFDSKLRKLRVDFPENLISMPNEFLQQLSLLEIFESELLSTSSLEQVFKKLSSLQKLGFSNCQSLTSISKGVEVLTTLTSLYLEHSNELELSPNEDGMPWKALKNLRLLEIRAIPKLLDLPSGLQNLVNLRFLKISYNDNLVELPEWIGSLQCLEFMRLYGCPKLTSLPEGFRKLTTLNALYIEACEGLTERCRGPNGRDWPKIQHISHVCVLENNKYIHDFLDFSSI
ncbi:unnamed protein product [Amaranthus hypochondriacus]